MKCPLLILPRLSAPTNPYVVENPGTSAFSLSNLCSDTVSLGGVSPWSNPQKLCHPLRWVYVTLTLGLLSCFQVVLCSLTLYSLTCMREVRSHLGALGQNTHPSQGDPSFYLVMFMCRAFSCVVGRGCLLWPVHSLAKLLLAFALLHFVPQGQTCLLLQVSLDFLLLHSSPLWWKGHLFLMLVLKGLVGLHRTIQLQLLQR